MKQRKIDILSIVIKYTLKFFNWIFIVKKLGGHVHYDFFVVVERRGAILQELSNLELSNVSL